MLSISRPQMLPSPRPNVKPAAAPAVPQKGSYEEVSDEPDRLPIPALCRGTAGKPPVAELQPSAGASQVDLRSLRRAAPSRMDSGESCAKCLRDRRHQLGIRYAVVAMGHSPYLGQGSRDVDYSAAFSHPGNLNEAVDEIPVWHPPHEPELSIHGLSVTRCKLGKKP